MANNNVVAGELYTSITGQLFEIGRQLRQKNGYPFNPEILRVHLQKAIEGKFFDPLRRELPVEYVSITHKFQISGYKGYLTMKLYEDETLGGIFISVDTLGPMAAGLLDSLASSVSIGLQYGVPLKVLVEKLSKARYEPSGFTGNSDIPIAKSIISYIFLWLRKEFIDKEKNGFQNLKDIPVTSRTIPPEPINRKSGIVFAESEKKLPDELKKREEMESPPCHECGSLMVRRKGGGYECLRCG
jgi:ribonucleoside-diphosphate reductase alpha chain